MAGLITFKLEVLNAQRLIYSGEVRSVCLVGDETEYELLPYHSPLIGVLKNGDIVIDHKLAIPIETGLVKFLENECVILAEEIEVGGDDGFDSPERIVN